MNGEPWRYECPQGHVSVQRRINDPVDPVSSPMVENRTEGVSPSHKFYCITCSQGYDELTDKKTGRRVTA